MMAFPFGHSVIISWHYLASYECRFVRIWLKNNFTYKGAKTPLQWHSSKIFFSIFTAIQICNMFEEMHIFTHCHHFMLYHCSFTCHTSSSIKQWCSWSHQKWMSFYKKQISMMWVQETEIKKATVWVCEKFLGGSIKFFPKSEQLQFFLVDQKV